MTEMENDEEEKYVPHNLDNSDLCFEADSKILFNPAKHIYYTREIESLMPTTMFVATFFNEFDEERNAANVARRENVSVEEIKERWEHNRMKAADSGTFMHKQIENYFNGLDMENEMRFVFDGIFKRDNCIVNIDRELALFRNFRNSVELAPFRTEWRVFDPEIGVAGTIDLICRNADGSFSIYDWKRSNKIDPNGRIFNYGRNGLEHLPDTSYYHYCLQQNVYRYILEQNYGVRIKEMNLVTLHPDLPNFKVVNVPRMEREITTMVSYLKARK